MRAERWVHEASFFDRLAERLSERIEPIDPRTLARYRRPLRRRFNKEYRFRLLGRLEGRRVLDLGCGGGSNAVLLAMMGARVTGIDISPKSIELARARARVNGVESRIELICGPIETAEFPEHGFDVVWGDGILHHLIDELDGVMGRLVRWAKDGALVVFSEPVNLNPALRALRLKLPVHTEATADERPLEMREVDLIRRHLPDLQMRCFSMLGRLDRFVLAGHGYERSSVLRRAASNLMHAVDWAVLSVRGLHTLGGMAVMHGRVRK